MTKQNKSKQQKMLQAIFEKTAQTKISHEVDVIILDAARTELVQRKDTSGKDSFINWPFNLTLPAVASVGVTAMFFLILSQLLSIPVVDIPLTSSSQTPVVFVETELQSPTLSASQHTLPEKHLDTVLANHNYVVRLSADEVLQQIRLPNVTELIAQLDKDNPVNNTAEIRDKLKGALADINLHIESGQLNKARGRYIELRQSCEFCELPETLEQLALGKHNMQSHG